MRRKILDPSPCPIGRALNEIGDWWTLLIVREALQGANRFRDFERLKISKNILSARLKMLLEKGIFELRESHESDNTFSTYQLTEKGEKLWMVLVSLRQWGEEFLFLDGEEMTSLVDYSGTPVRRLSVLDSKGKELSRDQTTLALGTVSDRRDRTRRVRH